MTWPLNVKEGLAQQMSESHEHENETERDESVTRIRKPRMSNAPARAR